MKNTHFKLRIKILYYLIYFILFIKFAYLFFFIYDKYLKIHYRGVQKNKTDTKTNEKQIEKINYYKTLFENVFIVSSSILLAYLFYPYHHNDLLQNFINNKIGRFLIFVYSFVVLITFNWQSFKPDFI